MSEKIELKGKRLKRASEITGEFLHIAWVISDPLGYKILQYHIQGPRLGDPLVRVSFPLNPDQWKYIWFGKEGTKKLMRAARKRRRK